MIIVEIKGGIGNQLFQYAAARSLAFKNDTGLTIDKSFFEIKGYSKRDLSIQKLNINPKIKFRNNLKKLKYLRKVPFLINIAINEIVEEKNKEFIYEPLNYKENKINIMSGYFQSHNFFEDIRGLLLEEIKPKERSVALNKYINLLSKAKLSVSLHVRRGDYVNLGWDLKTDYYINALSKFFETIENRNDDKIEIFIFSDDIEWCKNNLINEIKRTHNLPLVLVDDSRLKDYEEIFLMSLCENNIISNSTFSWWGAWLNQNNKKIVIAPEKWIDNKNSDDFDIIPKDWITVEGGNCEKYSNMYTDIQKNDITDKIN